MSKPLPGHAEVHKSQSHDRKSARKKKIYDGIIYDYKSESVKEVTN